MKFIQCNAFVQRKTCHFKNIYIFMYKSNYFWKTKTSLTKQVDFAVHHEDSVLLFPLTLQPLLCESCGAHYHSVMLFLAWISELTCAHGLLCCQAEHLPANLFKVLSSFAYFTSPVSHSCVGSVCCCQLAKSEVTKKLIWELI